MKTGKLFTIDVEIAERLKNINASQLVNGLLKEYFELRSDKNTLKEEKKAVLSSIIKKKDNFLKRLRSFPNGIRLILIITLKHGLKQGWRSLKLLWLKPTLTEEGVKYFLQTLSKVTRSGKETESSSND